MNIKKLQKAVEKSEISKAELASITGVTRMTLDNVLAGSDTKVSTIEKLSKALDISIGYLFDEEVNSNVSTHGSHSPASVFGNASVNQANENETKYLHKLLDEKERLIQILLKSNQAIHPEQSSVTEGTTCLSPDKVEAFCIVKSTLYKVLPTERITYKDNTSYFLICIDGNENKPICRISLNTDFNKQISFKTDDGKWTSQRIETLDGIYKYSEQITEVTQKYL